MSLSVREQHALTSIEHRLAGSDPTLAALMAGFTRLVSGEEMPVRERIRAPARWGWISRRLRTQQTVLLVWLIIAIAMIAVALEVGRGSGPATCKASWATVCTSHAPGHGPGYAAG